MSTNEFPRILRPAPRGSKRGWTPLTFEVPPELAERLQRIADQRPAFRGDLLHEAVALYVADAEQRAA